MHLQRSWSALALILALVTLTVPAAAQDRGRVTGQVTDAATLQALNGAQVVIEGTTIGTLTNADGRFLILNAPAGQQQVRVVMLGFAQQTQTVDVPAGGTVNVDFALSTSAIRLSGLTVSTITGKQQRARELGTNVARITVSTDVVAAAVTSISDILSGRTEGLILQDVNGTTGSSQKIRIRGANSLSLSNEPLVYIDGVLMTTGMGGNGVGGQEPSRLNDLNPSDIESIEILKGPAASALYGTAAANGVLLITTKRGVAGASRWNVYVETGELEEVTDWPLNYVQLQNIDASQPILLPSGSFNTTAYSFCSNRARAAGTCTVDQSLSFNTLEDPRTTPFSTGFIRRYGFSVAGGTERLTYFVSGELHDERGVIDYNRQDKFSLRANFNAAVREDFDLFVTTAYSASKLDLNSNDNSIFSSIINGLAGTGVYVPPDPDEPDQVHRRNMSFGFNQTDLKNWVAEQEIDRFTLGANADYRPLTWLSANLNVGMDLTDRNDFRTLQAGLLPIATSFRLGRRESDRSNNYVYTGNTSVTATFPVRDWINSTSTAGVSYSESLFERTECFGSGLVQGTASCGTTSTLFSVDEDFSNVITIGYFFSQEFALNDRLFLAGSFRGDDNSAFGTDFGFTTYLSTSASWVIGEEAWFPEWDFISNLRLRSAYGQSGLRPNFRQAVTLFSATSVTRGGDDVSGVRLSTTGNTLLKPEKTTEKEFGLDAGLFNDRVGVAFTYFTKTSRDALISKRIAPSFGLTASVFDNLGSVRNRGTELGVSLAIFDSETVGLDLSLTQTTISNKILSLGEDIEPIVFNRGTQRHQEGESAGAYFQPTVTWNDADGNGFLTNDEVTVGDESVFQGVLLPKWNRTAHASLRLFDWFRVSTLFEARGGNKQLDTSERFRCGFRSTRGCKAVASPDATLFEQARYIASRFKGSKGGYIEDADFLKWRELSLTLTPPASLIESVPTLDGLSLTVAGRNLAVWTKYNGIDPEVSERGASANFSQNEFNTQPPVRQLQIRLTYQF